MKLFDSMNAGYQEKPRTSLRQVPMAFWAGLLVLGCLMFIGWRLFLFTTDDAYIAFRYVSNSVLGRGYTWNPPPFRPVEGYTSFLWVVLLEAIWRLTGIEPPAAANTVALLFSFGTLFYTALLGLRMRLAQTGTGMKGLLVFLALLGVVTNRTFLAWTSSGLETAMFNFFVIAWFYYMTNPLENKGRWLLSISLLVFLALLGVVTNRTFLAWTSSGLETAMFNFFVIAWFYYMTNPRENKGRWLLSISLLSALVYFSRPDGLLFVACTVFVTLAGWAVSGIRKRDLLFLFPLLSVPAHFLWRRYYYGAWLPNTYYAKHVSAWPESGIRYLASFVMEYTFWLLVPLAALYLWKRLRKITEGSPARLRINIPLVAAVATVCVHIGYYTFIIGGDHFEYRVYSYLVPLLFIAAAYLIAGMTVRRGWAVAALCVFVLASYPIPWTHWYETKDLNTREETHMLFKPVASYFPSFMRGYVGMFDGLQDWLISHYVGLRHQEHKVLLLYLKEQFADMGMTRAMGMQIPWKPDHPVTNQRVLGYIGWMFPNVAVIDTAGLNDYVVARTPVKKDERRYMAHEREALGQYLDCFKGTDYLDTKAWKTGLTDAEIIDCENRWGKWADQVRDNPSLPPPAPHPLPHN